jgi:carboxypeptidase Taq
MTAYDNLMAQERETQGLAQVAGRLGWDQETVMPRGAAGQRAEESGAMQAVLHARRSDARRGDLLARAEAEVTGEVARAQLRHIRRDFDRATLVPGDLAVALARLTSRAQGQWAEARAGDDYAAFAPVLAEVIRLKREEAAAVARGRDPYDALIDDFEPEMTAARLESLFSEMRPRLVDLRARALDRDWPVLDAHFDEQAQLRLSRELARRFGYDFARGRLDMAVHPFSSGSGDDVRITTRVSEQDPFNCLYSTIHEVGHACYEQGIDPDYRLTPLGQGVSMGVHESQSRIYENQLGRSRAFTG